MTKAGRIEKCISRFITAILLALALFIFCPSFLITTKASEDDTIVWHVDSVASKVVFSKQFTTGYTNSANLNFVLETLSAYSFSSFNLPDLTDDAEKLIITYSPFTYSVFLSASRKNFPADNYVQSSILLGNINPFIIDNFGNMYPLDADNGGSFIIEDYTNITSLSLYFQGTVSGTQPLSPTGVQLARFNIYGSISDFDIILSTAKPLRTITDSEDTVWTVPEEVENPVVISAGGVWKYLFDASDLKYISSDINNNEFYILVSENIQTVNLYNQNGSLYNSYTFDILNQNHSIPFYVAPFNFDEFLYGSLPELQLGQEPEPTPTPTPAPDDKFEHINITRYEVGTEDDGYIVWDASDNSPQRDFYGVMNTPDDKFVIRSSVNSVEAVDTKDDLYHVHYDEYISNSIYAFSGPAAPYDGYCVISFPNGLYFTESKDGSSFPVGSEYVVTSHKKVYVTPYILLQGVRYEISDFGCQFTFPVYEGQPISYTIGYEAHILADVLTSISGQTQWKFNFDIHEFDMAIWYYTDNNEVAQIYDELQKQTDELKKQTDDLEKYPGADKMDEDKANLDSAIKDYDEVSDSIFESAGEGIDNFDISSGFNFNSSILSSIGFIGTIISSIIVAMGDFSMLYTIGVCLVIVSVIIGLFKYFGGDD